MRARRKSNRRAPSNPSFLSPEEYANEVAFGETGLQGRRNNRVPDPKILSNNLPFMNGAVLTRPVVSRSEANLQNLDQVLEDGAEGVNRAGGGNNGLWGLNANGVRRGQDDLNYLSRTVNPYQRPPNGAIIVGGNYSWKMDADAALYVNNAVNYTQSFVTLSKIDSDFTTDGNRFFFLGVPEKLDTFSSLNIMKVLLDKAKNEKDAALRGDQAARSGHLILLYHAVMARYLGLLNHVFDMADLITTIVDGLIFAGENANNTKMRSSIVIEAMENEHKRAGSDENKVKAPIWEKLLKDKNREELLYNLVLGQGGNPEFQQRYLNNKPRVA